MNTMRMFVPLYLLYVVIFFVLIELEYFKAIFHINDIYTVWITKVSGRFIDAIGIHNTTYETFIHLSNRTLEVKFGCSGLEAVVLYVSAILAYRATFKQKAYGLLLGIILVEMINIVRIAALAYISIYHNDVFDIIHRYVTQNIMIVLVFLLFSGYLLWIAKDKDGT